MEWLSEFTSVVTETKAYEYVENHPAITLIIGAIAFLMVRRKFRAILMLVFGTTLCWANYLVFSPQSSFALPLLFSACFAGISVVLLLLISIQFIHSA